MTFHDRRTPLLAEEHAQHRALLMSLRARAESEIERLIAMLDDLDGDPDLEPNGDDEFSLGWPANVSQLALGDNTLDGDATALERHGAGFRPSGRDDAEDGGDDEPSLASPETCRSQLLWAQGAGDGFDREQDVADEPHDEKDEGEREPWLGAPENHPVLGLSWQEGIRRDDRAHQLDWAAGGSDDREDEAGDSPKSPAP